MTIAELREQLSEFPDDMEIMILDGFNGGGGVLLEINIRLWTRTITDEDVADTADCEGRVGEAVVVIGYGSY
jgi:hypothetical protein